MALRWREERDGMASRPSRRRERERVDEKEERERDAPAFMRRNETRGQLATDEQR
jgi:hypothetical protein